MEIVKKIVSSKLIIRFFPIFLIVLFSFLSLHETINMFFVGDDFGFVYRMKTRGTYPWPQHQLINMYHPLYDVFGGDPKGYFTVGFSFFAISAILFYFLAQSIFSKKSHALIAALVYSTAPIGIESTIMMVVYLGTFYALALLSLILLFFLKFLKTGRLLFYILCVIFSTIAFETVTYRAYLFPLVLLLFSIFFWDRKKISGKKLIASYVVIAIFWSFFYLFRVYLLDRQNDVFVTNLNPSNILQQFANYKNMFAQTFLGNNFYNGLDSALVRDIVEKPIRALNPLIGTINIIYTIPFGKIIPLLHIPLSIILILFSVLVFFKRKLIQKDNFAIYFASIAFIFAEVLSFFIPFPKNIMPSRDHYASYALPGYALLIASVYLILVVLFNKRKSLLLRNVPHILLAILIFMNLTNTQKFLTTYNKRISYVRPFFKQLKQLMPTILITNPTIYIQPVVHLDDDPAEARWRLYDIWHGGIMGGNAVFGLYYDKVDANKTLATPVWDTVVEFAKENPEKNIERVLSFDYDLKGLHLTTEQTRKTLRSLLLENKNP